MGEWGGKWAWAFAFEDCFWDFGGGQDSCGYLRGGFLLWIPVSCAVCLGFSIWVELTFVFVSEIPNVSRARNDRIAGAERWGCQSREWEVGLALSFLGFYVWRCTVWLLDFSWGWGVLNEGELLSFVEPHVT